MIGVVLAGGSGTRLKPTTNWVNKHVLLVGKIPMVAYPIWTLMGSGLNKIVVVVGRPFEQQVIDVVKSMKIGGVKIEFAIQEQPDGVPSAIGISEGLVGQDSMMVVTGDTIHGGVYKRQVKSFKTGGLAFLRKVDEPKRYAIPIYDKTGKLVRLEEKPKKYDGEAAICGPLFFDKTVFAKIKTLNKSRRGETELVDLYDKYMQQEQFKLIEANDYCEDVGTKESLARVSYELANNMVELEHDYLKNASEDIDWRRWD